MLSGMANGLVFYAPLDSMVVVEGNDYGAPRDAYPGFHQGKDLRVPQGTPVYSSVDGVVTFCGDDGLGNWVVDVTRSDGLTVRDGHLSRMDVELWQTVSAKQQIGLSGGTPGTPGAGTSTGPHLHWETRWDSLWNGGGVFNPSDLNPTPRPKPKPKDWLDMATEAQVRKIFREEIKRAFDEKSVSDPAVKKAPKVSIRTAAARQLAIQRRIDGNLKEALKAKK